MNPWLKWGLLLVMVVSLGACGSSQVSQQDLMKNTWQTEDPSKDLKGAKVLMKFDEKKMTMNFDFDEATLDSSFSELENSIIDGLKKVMGGLEMSFSYTLQDGKFTMTNDEGNPLLGDLDLEQSYSLRKDGQNIIMTPADKSKESESVTLIPSK